MSSDDCPDTSGATVMTDGNRYFSLFLCIASCLYFAAGIAWWWTRRHHTLLRKRSFGLMLVSTGGCLIAMLLIPVENYVGVAELPCLLKLIFSFYLLPIATGPLVVRMALAHNEARFQSLVTRTRGEGQDAFEDWLLAPSSRWQELLSYASFVFCFCAADDGRALVATASNPDMTAAGDGNGAGGPSGGNTKVAAAPRGIALSADGSSTVAKRRQVNRTRAALFRKSSPYAALAQGIVVLLASASVAVVAAGEPYFANPACSGCRFSTQDFALLPAVGVGLAIAYAYMIYTTWRSPDPLGVLRELRQSFVACLFLLLGSVISAADPGGVYKAGKFDWLYMSVFALLALFTIMCPLQVWRTYADDSLRAAPRDHSTDLRRVLANPELKRAFTAYLATEWSTENAVFLDMVDRYKESCASEPPRAAAMRALEIYTTCILDHSMLEVNVSGDTRKTLHTRMSPLMRAMRSNEPGDVRSTALPGPEVFDVAYAEIYKLLETDPLPRFFKSDAYRALDVERGRGAKRSP